MTIDQHIAATEKAAKALALRRAGYTYREIAKQVGYAGPSGVAMAINKAMKDMLSENGVNELRALEAARLDELQKGQWDKAKAGDVRAVEIVLKVMERRARLLGLDMPIRQEIDAVVATAEPIITDSERAKRILAIVENARERESHNGHEPHQFTFRDETNDV